MNNLGLLIPFIFGGLLIAFGGFFIRMGMLSRAFDRQIAAVGVDGEAVITSHRKEHVDLRNGGGRDEFYITFEFTVNNPEKRPEKISQESQISSGDYERLNPGDKVAIRYLPDQPKEVILLNGIHEQTVPFFMRGGICGIIAGAALIILCVVLWLKY